jgi:hypothetical protein
LGDELARDKDAGRRGDAVGVEPVRDVAARVQGGGDKQPAAGRVDPSSKTIASSRSSTISAGSTSSVTSSLHTRSIAARIGPRSQASSLAVETVRQ